MPEEIFPFRPAAPSGEPPEVEAQLRIAAALEYVAVQLGQINMRLQRAEDEERAKRSAAPAEVVSNVVENDELEALTEQGLK